MDDTPLDYQPTDEYGNPIKWRMIPEDMADFEESGLRDDFSRE